MRIAWLILVELAVVLLAAHALRRGDLGLTAAMLATGGLVFSRREFARYVLMGVLGFGLWLWIDTAMGFIRVRQALGQDWTRLAVIMAGVAAFDAAALLSLGSRRAKDWFHKNRNAAPAQALALGLTVALLALARIKSPFPVLMLDRVAPAWGWAQVGLHGLYASWLAGIALQPHGHTWLRPRLWAFFSLVFFGQLAIGLAGAEIFLMTGELHLPVPALIVGGPLFRGEGFFMLILFVSTIVLVGPAWCSHLCYIGAWDDLASRAGSAPRPRSGGRWLTLGRGLTLGATVLLAVVFRLLGVPPFTAGVVAAAFGLVGVGIMVVVSRRRGSMIHCTTYCPIGLLGNMLGRISPWRVRMNEQCTGCGVCAKACRYGALEPFDIERRRPGLSCTLCGDCVGRCAHSAMGYSFPGLSPERARVVFLVVVIGLHAAFLGVARM
jgi:ferredoxin